MLIEHRAIFPQIVSVGKDESFESYETNLVEWIYKYRGNTEGIHKTNRGGWQSPPNVHLNESFEDFLGHILECLRPMLAPYDLRFHILSMWININEKGSYNIEHDHPNCVMAGVFWVKTGENCGSLVLKNPNSHSQGVLMNNVNSELAKEKSYFEDITVLPESGSMILFPSGLRHSVEMNESEEDRISIAFNIDYEKHMVKD